MLHQKITIHLTIFFVFFSFYTKGENYLNYNVEMFKAELQIASSHYDAAIAIYESTFNQFHNHFYKDLHNYCLCFIKLGNINEALKVSKDLVLHGYEIQDFDSTFLFLRRSNLWEEFNKEYPELRTRYEFGMDSSYRTMIDRLFQRDQMAAQSESIQKQDSIFYINSLLLTSIFQSKGFPSTFLNKDSLNVKILVLLRHFFGLYNRFHQNPELQKDDFYKTLDFSKINLISVVKASLYGGWLSTNDFLHITTYFDNANTYGNPVLKINLFEESIALVLLGDNATVQTINSNREKIGLFPIINLGLDSLTHTWHRNYPYKKIKTACLSCENCKTTKDYLELIMEIHNDHKERSSSTSISKEFILAGFDYNGIYLEDIDAFLSNLNE